MSGTRHQYGIKQHEQRRKRDRQMRCLITIVAVCIVLILAYMIAGVLRKKAVLTLQFENVAILQGEDVPTLKAKVKVEKDDGPTLDKKSKYTSKDFIRDLKKGKGYKIICKVDPKTEGSYKATIKLSESLQKKLDDGRRINLNVTMVLMSNLILLYPVVILIILMRMARWQLAGIQLRVQHIISIKKESCRPAGRRMAQISII